ncbi:DUF5443 family protein [Mycoplasmoides genitalium]|uniref:DUF5443 family protein n=1 Tax=Mycoplasmoides genitalium TaxID=2097 RepID=UPI00027B3E35|nr:DUF5443 family protein [Mycoplasmoides genitalium]AFQ03606.1 hypothetical protein CM3_01795 [Mycoplasmoides genitalium M6282]
MAAILNVQRIQNNQVTEYTMSPVRNFANTKDVYFDAQLTNIESKIDSSRAQIHLTIALKYNTNLPDNIFQAHFSLGNWQSDKIQLQKAPDKKHDSLNSIKYFYAFLDVPRSALAKKEINRFSNVVARVLRISFRLQDQSEKGNWSDYHLFDTVASELYATVIKETINFGNMIKINALDGSKQLTSSQGSFKYSWTMYDYRNLEQLDEVRNLINISFDKPVQIVNVDVKIHYVPTKGRLQEIKQQGEFENNLDVNEKLKLNLIGNWNFDKNNKKLISDISGTGIFLPQGGYGSYEIMIGVTVGNDFYTIIANNQFKYETPLDDLEQNDFFEVNYLPVYSTYNFSDLTQ